MTQHCNELLANAVREKLLARIAREVVKRQYSKRGTSALRFEREAAALPSRRAYSLHNLPCDNADCGKRDKQRARPAHRRSPQPYGGNGRPRRLRWRSLSDLERIDPDRLGDVLELRRAQIVDGEIEPRFHLPIGVLRQTDGTGLGHSFQARSDIDTVAHQVAVALLDHVAEMNADAVLNPALRRKPRVALRHSILHLDGATNGVDNASELNEDAIARPLNDATVVYGDGRIDQIAS